MTQYQCGVERRKHYQYEAGVGIHRVDEAYACIRGESMFGQSASWMGRITTKGFCHLPTASVSLGSILGSTESEQQQYDQCARAATSTTGTTTGTTTGGGGGHGEEMPVLVAVKAWCHLPLAVRLGSVVS